MPVYAAHVHAYPISHRLRSVRERLHTEFISDMLPASLLRMAASKTANPTLTANLIHPAPLISAFLSTSCPASNLVQTEVDNNGIATVSICVRFDKAGNFSNRAKLKKIILRFCAQVKLARAPVNSLNLELLQVGKS